MSAGVESIAILTHARQGLPVGTFLRHIAEQFWQPAGRRVVRHLGLGAPPPAEVAILHVDLTRSPGTYAELAARYPVALNRRALDISKHRVCTDLVTADDPYDGPVIVKTDRNHGGRPERLLALASRHMLVRLREHAARALPPAWTGRLPDDAYQTFPRKGMVPGWVWRSRGLVVQPLHVERADDLFVLHQWFFLGDRDIVSSYCGAEPVVKRANVVRRLPLHAQVPPEIRRRRAELGFDYGKFDYVIENGEPVLLDANLAPSNGVEVINERAREICGHLAGGIDAFVNRAR